jgi:ABC-2 type transport system permease protein
MKPIFALFYKEILYHRAYPLDLLNLAIGPFFIIGPFVFVAKIYGENIQNSVTMGLIIWYWFSMFFWGVGYGVRDEIEEGVMENIASTPAPLWSLLVAKALDTLLINIYITITILALLKLFANITIVISWVMFIFILLASSFALGSLSFVFAGIVLLTKQASELGNLIQEGVGILAGMTAPTSTLPRAVQWVSAAIPLTYAIQGARNIISGQDAFMEIGVLILFGACLLPLGWYLISKVEFRLRQEGSIGEY